jgi:predicted nuclease of predicted toxin-antitoxin system
MRFLVDNQLPPSLARWLRDRGHGAVHVFESGPHLLDDRDL